MKVSLSLVVFSLLQAITVVSSATRPSAMNETQTLLSRTISSINSVLRFFNKEHRNVNLDTVIGTRMLEGKNCLYYIVWHDNRTMINNIDY